MVISKEENIVLVDDLHTLKNLERVKLITLHAFTGKMRYMPNIAGGEKVRCWFVQTYMMRSFVFNGQEYTIRFHPNCKFPFVYRIDSLKTTI